MVRLLQRNFIVMELIQDMAQVEAYRFLFHKNYGKLAAGKLIEEMTFTCRKSHSSSSSSSERNF